MNTYKLRIASPDGSFFDGDAVALMLRGTCGDLAILAGHIPFVTAVKPGKVRLTLPDGSERQGQTEGGILTVTKSETTLLSGSFSW